MNVSRRAFLAVAFAPYALTAQGRLTPDVARLAVARFEGTLRTYDKKQFVVEIEDGQTLIFRRTKSTKIQPKDIQLGVHVQVDARKDAVGDLDAIRVCADKCSAGK